MSAPAPRRGASPLLILAGLAVAFALGQAAWCAWEWSQHPARWIPLPALAAWGVAILQVGLLAVACRRASPALAGLAATLAALELLLVDGRGRAWMGLALPAALWASFLLSSLELVRWWSWLRGTSSALRLDGSLADMWRAYAARAPLLVAAGLAAGLAAARVPAWAAPWLGPRWAQGIEADAAFTAGAWVLALHLVACSVWLATRPAPRGTDPEAEGPE
jgi:hypothetical protein